MNEELSKMFLGPTEADTQWEQTGPEEDLDPRIIEIQNKIADLTKEQIDEIEQMVESYTVDPSWAEPQTDEEAKETNEEEDITEEETKATQKKRSKDKDEEDEEVNMWSFSAFIS